MYIHNLCLLNDQMAEKGFPGVEEISTNHHPLSKERGYAEPRVVLKLTIKWWLFPRIAPLLHSAFTSRSVPHREWMGKSSLRATTLLSLLRVGTSQRPLITPLIIQAADNWAQLIPIPSLTIRRASIGALPGQVSVETRDRFTSGWHESRHNESSEWSL